MASLLPKKEPTMGKGPRAIKYAKMLAGVETGHKVVYYPVVKAMNENLILIHSIRH